MPSMKDVLNKIASVKKTKQITKAMNMVASAKLRKAQERIEQFRPYAQKYYEMLGDLAAGVEPTAHPLLEPREEIKSTGILLMTSDRGLCGAYNAYLINMGLQLARQKAQEGKEVKFYCVGRKGRDKVKKSNFQLLQSYPDRMNYFDFSLAAELGKEVTDAYLGMELDEVHMIYGQFLSVAKQQATTLQILPVTATQQEESAGASVEYTYEPSVEGILKELLPRFINVQIYRGLLETAASEHAARMTAMDNATRNCDDMIADLTLSYNKARQAAITTELMDIVGGAEALKG
ncbi:MAG: F0F1 ATP synthase subunit gamma [Desulfohalobiaceae bacterium]